MKRYGFTGKKMSFAGHKLYQIQALVDFDGPFSGVKAGQIGGWIESEDNLLQETNGWVADNAKVYGNVVVRDSLVQDEAIVCDNNSDLGFFVSITDSVICDRVKMELRALDVCQNEIYHCHISKDAKISGCLTLLSTNVGAGTNISGYGYIKESKISNAVISGSNYRIMKSSIHGSEAEQIRLSIRCMKIIDSTFRGKVFIGDRSGYGLIERSVLSGNVCLFNDCCIIDSELTGSKTAIGHKSQVCNIKTADPVKIGRSCRVFGPDVKFPLLVEDDTILWKSSYVMDEDARQYMDADDQIRHYANRSLKEMERLVIEEEMRNDIGDCCLVDFILTGADHGRLMRLTAESSVPDVENFRKISSFINHWRKKNGPINNVKQAELFAAELKLFCGRIGSHVDVCVKPDGYVIGWEPKVDSIDHDNVYCKNCICWIDQKYANEKEVEFSPWLSCEEIEKYMQNKHYSCSVRFTYHTNVSDLLNPVTQSLLSCGFVDNEKSAYNRVQHFIRNICVSDEFYSQRSVDRFSDVVKGVIDAIGSGQEESVRLEKARNLICAELDLDVPNVSVVAAVCDFLESQKAFMSEADQQIVIDLINDAHLMIMQCMLDKCVSFKSFCQLLQQGAEISRDFLQNEANPFGFRPAGRLERSVHADYESRITCINNAVSDMCTLTLKDLFIPEDLMDHIKGSYIYTLDGEIYQEYKRGVAGPLFTDSDIRLELQSISGNIAYSQVVIKGTELGSYEFDLRSGDGVFSPVAYINDVIKSLVHWAEEEFVGNSPWRESNTQGFVVLEPAHKLFPSAEVANKVFRITHNYDLFNTIKKRVNESLSLDGENVVIKYRDYQVGESGVSVAMDLKIIKECGLINVGSVEISEHSWIISMDPSDLIVNEAERLESYWISAPEKTDHHEERQDPNGFI